MRRRSLDPVALGVLALALALAGCRHRGAAWTEPVPPVAGAVEIFVLGQPREGPETRAVALELDRELQEATDAGRTPIVLWLGTDFGERGPDGARRCPTRALAYQSPGLRELSEVVMRAVERGGSAWGLPGPDGFRCNLTGMEAPFTPLPYQQPGLAYVLRVSNTGAVALVSSCDGSPDGKFSCTVTNAPDDALVELVALDSSFWHYRDLIGDDLSATLLEQQASLLDALARQPPRPRILFSPIPIETAGKHGMGGRKQRTAFHYVPPFLQDALASGLFVGVLGALERDLEVSFDLSNAILRSQRRFVGAPIFEVVSGSAGGASHTFPTSRANSLLPDLESEHTGFASLVIDGNTPATIHLRVHAHVAARWRVAGIDLPLEPAPLEPLRETPPIHPCSSCDPQRGASEGDRFVPRGKRPH